jgi:hypothetical protein
VNGSSIGCGRGFGECSELRQIFFYELQVGMVV